MRDYRSSPIHRCTVFTRVANRARFSRKSDESVEYRPSSKNILESLLSPTPTSFVPPWLRHVARGARANRREARPPHHTCEKITLAVRWRIRTLQRGRPKVNGILSRSFARAKGDAFRSFIVGGWHSRVWGTRFLAEKFLCSAGCAK